MSKSPQNAKASIPLIERYRFGHIRINQKSFSRDLIITPEKVFPHWQRAKSHSLTMADLAIALEASPQELIIGTGYFGRLSVPLSLVEELQARGIRCHILPTRKAWQLYNHLAPKRRTVAAFHLTC
ncbi:MAG: hypothetical protein J7M05_00290 [Anaerolineae bacterium]|nr:hypothetical protein [Anaerolineae bacterium]